MKSKINIKTKIGIAVTGLVLALLSGCVSTVKKKLPDEQNPQYQYEKGVISLRYGLVEEAIRYANKAISLDPNHFNSLVLLGSAYFTNGEFEKSIEAYEKAMSLQPQKAEVHKFLGLVFVEMNNLTRAEIELKKAVELNDEDFEALFQLGKLYYSQQKLEDALVFAEKSIKAKGSNVAAYNLKGVVLNQLGRYKEAIGSFEAGLILAPDDIGLQINLGIACLNNNEIEKGRSLLESVLPKIKDAVLKAKVENYLDSIKEFR